MFKKGSYLYYAMANGMFYFSWGMFASIISVYLATIGCSATEISLITSASSMFAIVTQPLAGFLADKFESPQKVSIVSAVMVIISGMAFAYSKSFVFLFLFNGFTQGLLNGITALSDRMATASPYPFGTIRVWGSILYAVACQISGIVFEKLNPMFNYYIFAVGMVLMLIGFVGMHDAKPKNNTATNGNKNKVSTKEMVKLLWNNSSFKMFMLIYFLFWGVSGAQGVYQPLLMTSLGGTTSMIGTTFLFSTLSELPMVLFSDKIMKRFSYKQLLIFACVMSLIRFAFYSMNPDPAWIMYAFFFQGTTTIVFIMVAVRITMELVDEKYVNSAYGISNMLAKGVAVVIFQIVFGQIVDRFGYSMMYYLAFIVMAITLVLSLRFKMPEKRRNSL